MATDDIELFSAWLAQHHRGTTDAELTAGLRDLIAEVVRQQKAGTITLTVKVHPQEEWALGISARCEIKPPKEEARALFYFVDEHNMPTRRDPQQPLFNDDKDTADHG